MSVLGSVSMKHQNPSNSQAIDWRNLLAVLPLACLLLVACGDGGDSEPSPTTRTALLPAVTELPTDPLLLDVATPAATPDATPTEVEDPPATP